MSNDTDQKRWERISRLIREADNVPSAPDCRDKVMARIASPRMRLSWAYALAAVLIAVVGCIALLPHPTSNPKAIHVANRQTTTVRQATKHTSKPTAIIAVAPTTSQAAVKTPTHRAYRARKQLTAHIAPRPTVKQSEVARVPSAPAPIKATAQQPLTAAHPSPPPVAIAIITWPSAKNAAADSYSYAYTDRDTATGKTTECRVKRSGDSVQIYMESKPEEKEAPTKGSIDHETNNTNV